MLVLPGDRARKVVALSALLAAIGAPGRALSQQQPRDTVPRASSPGETSGQRQASSQASPLLDTPVSRTAYRLGPGDVLDVAIIGDPNTVQSVPVTPEGTVVIPRVGVAKVLGLNLDEAQSRVRDLVLRLFRGVEVSVTLSRVRT